MKHLQPFWTITRKFFKKFQKIQIFEISLRKFQNLNFHFMKPYSPNSNIIITTYPCLYPNIQQIHGEIYHKCERREYNFFVLQEYLKIFLLFVCHCVVLYSSLNALSSPCILTYKCFSLFCFCETHVILLPLTLFCFVHLCFKI